MNRSLREWTHPAPGLSRVIWWDGLFEMLLGVVLATAAWTHLDTEMPISRPILAGFGIILIPVGIGLLVVSRSPARPTVRTLAAANAVGALVAVSWLAWGWSDFGPVGLVLVAVVSLVLGLLALAELALLRPA